MGHIRPTIDAARIEQVRRMIDDNPGWHRTRLSQEICMAWGWQGANGAPKDISCRDMLRSLEKAGQITLPAAIRTTRAPGMGADKINLMAHDTQAIETDVRSLMPLRLEMAESKEDVMEFKSYIAQYHYLGFDRSIGEGIKYFVKSDGGSPLACLMFGSAAWACAARDTYIGWDRAQMNAGRHLITGNSRFLIFPWVRSRHLASCILGMAARRISSDFQRRYGHPIVMLETFVERQRFRGTCYKAANWLHAGETTGRGRDSKSKEATLPVKDVWLCPLRPDARRILCAEARA